jgi:hypothetical protein
MDQPSLRSLHCSGKNDGDDCPCRRFTSIPSQDPDLPALCWDCHHPEGYHPLQVSPIAEIVSSYKDASKIAGLKTSSPIKASTLAATQESNAGLKRKRPVDESEVWSGKKVKVHVSIVQLPSFLYKQIMYSIKMLLPQAPAGSPQTAI